MSLIRVFISLLLLFTFHTYVGFCECKFGISFDDFYFPFIDGVCSYSEAPLTFRQWRGIKFQCESSQGNGRMFYYNDTSCTQEIDDEGLNYAFCNKTDETSLCNTVSVNYDSYQGSNNCSNDDDDDNGVSIYNGVFIVANLENYCVNEQDNGDSTILISMDNIYGLRWLQYEDNDYCNGSIISFNVTVESGCATNADGNNTSTKISFDSSSSSSSSSTSSSSSATAVVKMTFMFGLCNNLILFLLFCVFVVV